LIFNWKICFHGTKGAGRPAAFFLHLIESVPVVAIIKGVAVAFFARLLRLLHCFYAANHPRASENLLDSWRAGSWLSVYLDCAPGAGNYAQVVAASRAGDGGS
jgi:hypothetical protein